MQLGMIGLGRTGAKGVRRSNILKERGLHYMDVGTSGGVWGIDRGYCIMLGGAKESADRLDPIFKTVADGKGETAATLILRNSRFRSRQYHTFAEKMLSGMRNKFGGHVERAPGG